MWCEWNEPTFVVMFLGFRDVFAKIVRRGRWNLKVIQRWENTFWHDFHSLFLVGWLLRKINVNKSRNVVSSGDCSHYEIILASNQVKSVVGGSWKVCLCTILTHSSFSVFTILETGFLWTCQVFSMKKCIFCVLCVLCVYINGAMLVSKNGK